MKPDDPRHGTHAGAIQHWRAHETPCPPCALTARRYRKQANLEAERGNPRMTELGEQAWQIIKTGPLNQLADKTGMPTARLIQYRNAGPTKRVHRTTRDRILTAQLDWTPIGIQRRLQALSRLGWSMADLANETGLDLDGLKRLRRRERIAFIRLDAARAILSAYQRLFMTLPPNNRHTSKTRTHSTRAGWLPPLAWNNIDDPDERPQGWEYQPLADRRDQLEELVERGATLADALAELNVGRTALEKWVDNHGCRHLYIQLRDNGGVALVQYANQHTKRGAA